jgi:hypothetical protein
METEIKSYPCESVLVRKGLSKPLIVYQGERSQDGAAMHRRDEAGQPYFGGCRVGPTAARVSALWTKRESLASMGLPERNHTDILSGCRWYLAISPEENGS